MTDENRIYIRTNHDEPIVAHFEPSALAQLQEGTYTVVIERDDSGEIVGFSESYVASDKLWGRGSLFVSKGDEEIGFITLTEDDIVTDEDDNP